jgi:hypothetical protein
MDLPSLSLAKTATLQLHANNFRLKNALIVNLGSIVLPFLPSLAALPSKFLAGAVPMRD